MESEDPRHGRLDATGDREVVYCHVCYEEWYRADSGLRCPFCDNDMTEIVDPDNDPRDPHTDRSSALTSPEMPPVRFNENDSDPDEADIDEFEGPNGVHHRQSTREGINSEHHNPAVDPFLERFMSLVHDLRPPLERNANGAVRLSHVQYTSTMPGGGRAHVTLVTGSRIDPSNFVPLVEGTESQFSRLFSNTVHDVGPPEGGPPDMTAGLRRLLDFFYPQNFGQSGDAVFSQEAMDRVITNLMESNPLGNQNPPASEEAIRNLERQVLTESTIKEENRECTICIDEMKPGDTATTLPCKHWFHDECVVLWLKEHNTCPVCRSLVDKDAAPRAPTHGENTLLATEVMRRLRAERSEEHAHSHPGSDPDVATTPSSPMWQPIPAFGAGRRGSNPTEQPSSSRPTFLSRPPSQSQSRINETMRNITRQIQESRHPHPGHYHGSPPASTGGPANLHRRASTSGASYFPRRSHSPSSPRASHSSRVRRRSPSPNSRRSDRSEGSRRSAPGSGPISWLRDRFSGGGGSSDRSSRDDDRRSQG